ncbi:DUF977 family protein [Salmonella enterica]|nr:DUF977 family protein [Salmonella enterica]EEJ7180306.1 DUF977 family protein [Salmonella enterica subsp. enterica serovar Glostrup]EIS4514165.1 DUF977 family protein [Salmonella enterica]EJI2433884.1 DUF977 family protein [Salmonella enterica]ELZ3469560.1 DUF977 family protein [Salmonella enterica]
MSRNYTPEKRDEIQKRLTELVRKNSRMTFGELRRMTGLTIFTARHYLEKAESCGELYQAGRSGIFPSERDFRIWKRKQDDARVERFLNARLITGEPYDRSRNSICEECRNSYVMQRILAFYRGYQQGVIDK